MVLGFVDHTHAAASQFLHDTVVGNGLTGSGVCLSHVSTPSATGNAPLGDAISINLGERVEKLLGITNLFSVFARIGFSAAF